MKRIFDLFFSSFALLIFSPFLLIIAYLIWRQDKHTPFYIPFRVGCNGDLFKMVKFRSMTINADKSGVDSTATNDTRITPVGRFIRNYKIDEIMQLWSVLKGYMSLVGPRPNVKRDTDLYTHEEKKILNVKPGITSIASIVFSDEGSILEGKADPDIAYNQLIRPWKSRLDLIYIQQRSILLDIKLIYLTVVSLYSKKRALKAINKLLVRWNIDPQCIQVCKREESLYPFPPPGAADIVTSRQVCTSGVSV